MKVLDIRAFEGRNVHSHSPLIEMQVDLGEYEGQRTNAYQDFVRQLLEALPSLRDHYCSRGRRGGFVERLEEGTYFGHVIEHVALELQALAGMDVIYGKTRRSKDGLYNVFFEYQSRDAGVRAGQLAVEFIRSLLVGGHDRPVDELVGELHDVALSTGLGPSTAAIAEAARRRGIPCQRLGNGSLLQLGHGARQRRVWATITHKTGCISVDIACDKALTKQLLDDAAIPVPVGGVVTTEEAALELARKLGAPVVVKPHDGNQGKGVSLNLETAKDIRAAFKLARHHSTRVIVEQYIPGHHYRVLVVGGHVVAAAERLPATVMGDGKHSVKELVDIANCDPNRGRGHEKSLTYISIDPVVLLVLARQNLTINYVPAAGEKVRLRDNANLSTGGTALDVTDEVHPQVADLCERAARIIGLDVAGIDLVIPHISQPVYHGEGAVIEVNAAPGIRMHHFPSQGTARDVGEAIVGSLFPTNDDGRIPVVAITGTNGKTTITRLVNHMLQEEGYRTGMTTTDGIYIDGVCVLEGDTTGPRSARTVLLDDRVEAAVLESARGGLIRGGLAFDYCTIACVVNVGEDHLGQDGVETLEDLVEVKSLLVESVVASGASVLNADDPHVLSMLNYAEGEPILFSRRSDNINVHKHVAAGGRAVYVRHGQLAVCEDGEERALAPLRDIPITGGGRIAHNVENVLAATACGLGLGLKDRTLKRALQRFRNTPEYNPGRFNHFRIGNLNVVIDYGHNEDGYRAVHEAIQRFSPRRVTAVIGVPGDRTTDSIVKVGRTAGRLFDELIVKEDRDLRGRRPGEVADLLTRGALQAGFPEDRIHVILDEVLAVRSTLAAALGCAQQGYNFELGKDSRRDRVSVNGGHGGKKASTRQLPLVAPGPAQEDWIVIFFEKFQPTLDELLCAAERSGQDTFAVDTMASRTVEESLSQYELTAVRQSVGDRRGPRAVAVRTRKCTHESLPASSPEPVM